MSQRIFYEVDGRVHGPINLTQLQLMAASGMLLPHHRVKREGTEQWFAAQNVRGLFSDPTPAPPPVVPVGALVPQPAQRIAASVASTASADEEIPYAGFGAVESDSATAENAFDFFSDQPVAAPSAPPPKPAKLVKSPAKTPMPAPISKVQEPQPFELVETDAPGTVADSNIQAIENPFEFSEPAPPATNAARDAEPPMDLPEAEAIEDESPPVAPASMASGPMAAPGKLSESKSESKPAPKVGAAPIMPAAGAAEVTGRAVEFLPDDSLHLLDGKTIFRLHRSWLLATSKFADGSTRSTYLRLQRIDAGILEQRPSTSRGKVGPHSLLTFVAGETRVGLVFQGSDKLYRTFLERALLLGNVSGMPPKPAVKA